MIKREYLAKAQCPDVDFWRTLMENPGGYFTGVKWTPLGGKPRDGYCFRLR